MSGKEFCDFFIGLILYLGEYGHQAPFQKILVYGFITKDPERERERLLHTLLSPHNHIELWKGRDGRGLRRSTVALLKEEYP